MHAGLCLLRGITFVRTRIMRCISLGRTFNSCTARYLPILKGT
jgi:hypothetical protein